MEMMKRLTCGSAIRVVVALSAAILLAAGGSVRPTIQAQAMSNPVVIENGLAGSPQSEWDIEGAGDPTLQGFATDISVNSGSVVSFKIKTSAPGFVIDIYRLGYYQGLGARKIATVTPTAADIALAQTQPACETDAASGLIDCGNWDVTGSWNTAGVTSGIFIAKLSRTDNPDTSSHIYFIVRDDSRTSEILFQTSDTTWQAYNQYGGNSLYCGGPLSNSAGDYSCLTRAAKVSYNRPFDTRAHDPQSFLFNAEYPMVRWLEANGYDVKYWTGIDTDRFGADPAIGLTSPHHPKAFFSVGHDEYWSAGQRSHVETARNAGVSLAFFSGNEMFWKTRYEASIDGSNTTYRTLVSYKETFGQGSRVDPDATSPWTGTWRDPRFPEAGGGNPENSLIGQLWAVNCCSDRIHVPASMAGLRFWRNTAVANLAPGDPIGYRTSVESLGYEWDEVIDNGLLPPGLVRMSETTLVVPERVVDFGINVAQGTAAHSLTLYRHASGALVFGAGTVQWSWGLDAVHDRSQVQTDQAMQQATVNLLADMGVQPQTLQVGSDPNQPLLVPATMSSDTAAPTSTIVSPAAGSSAESGSRVSISGTAIENGSGSVAGVEVSVDGGTTWHTASLVPSGVWNYEWTPGSPGTATIRARAFDDSGNVEAASAGIMVSVVPGPCPCTSLWRSAATPIVPAAADNNPVEVGTKFYSDIDGLITGIRFYKGTANTGTHVGNLWTLTGTLLATVTFANESPSGWQQAIFSSPVAISANTTYVVSYHTNVGAYAADGAYFATAPRDSPPLHAPTSPVAGGNGVFAYGESQFPTGTFNATNYWVDVVFASTVADSNPPVISHVKATTVDSSRVTITWITDEESTSKIQYSTDPAILSGTSVLPPHTVTVNDAAFVTQHHIALSGLTTDTTYYYRVISVDHSGNAGDVPAPGVRVPGPTLRDTSSSDFDAGAGSNIYTSETADGEVILAPVAGIEFSGSTLPPGWIDVPYGTGGAALIGNGIALVDGSRLGTCVDVSGTCREQWALTPGHRLEFTATFTGDAFQHSGFAQDFSTASQPWAIFSTLEGGALTARTSTGATSQETSLGFGFLGSPHRYTIDWSDTRVVYSVDGAVVATHNLAVAGPMRLLAASDFSVFGGNVVIDWIRLGPFAVSGVFQSRVFDANTIVDWQSIQWKGSTPPGTSVAMSVRTGSTPDAEDGTWTGWQPIASPGSLALSSRYIQYRAVLATTDPAVTPELQDVIITTGHAPVAVDDSINTPQNATMTLPAAGPGSLVANDIDADNDVLEVVGAGPASHGTVFVNFDGSVQYTPAANYSGPDAFVYTVSDGLLTSSAVASIVVGSPNRPPVTNSDTVNVLEDSAGSSIAVLSNDTDPDPGQTLTVTAVSSAAHGVAAIAGNGTAVSYTPQADYFGADSFTYTVSDGHGGTATGTVALSVLDVNDAPAFTKGADQRVLETSGAQTVAGWAANMSAGPVNEAAQGLTFVVTNDNAALFSVQPSVAASGTLTYALAGNVNGVNHVAHVSVRLRDNGGTADGGVDTSDAQMLVISVIPGIDISDVMMAEGDSDITSFTFMVMLTGASDQPVSVSFATADSTATAPGEYTAAAGVLTFDPGVVSLPIAIGVSGDTMNEPDERFNVNLFNAINGTIKKAQGAGIIQNDDSVPSLTIGDATVGEGNSGVVNMTFTVTLSPQSGQTVRVNVATANGSALAPAEYTARSGTLTFAPGVVTQTITVPVIGNTVDTPNKTFTANLSAAVNANIADAQGVGTIVDDDTSLVTDTTTSDFKGGTADAGAYYSESGNGEVMLTPALGTEFSGPTLPSGWVSTLQTAKGTVKVNNGSVKLQGAQITSTLPLISGGRSMEFAATFNGQQQFAGLSPAQFNTKLTGTKLGLYARTVNGSKTVETLIPGSWFGAPHRFRIDWNTTTVVYWIDGAKVATHTASFPATMNMTMVASDVTRSSGVLTIDWMRSTPYAAAGTYTSKVFDAGAPVGWLTMSWSFDKPAGTDIVVSYRTGNTPKPDATWTAFATVPASGGALAGSSRYIQYKLQESTTNTAQAPAVKDLVIAFNR